MSLTACSIFEAFHFILVATQTVLSGNHKYTEKNNTEDKHITVAASHMLALANTGTHTHSHTHADTHAVYAQQNVNEQIR